MALEGNYLDVLQNIEWAILSEARQDKSINDLDARDAIAALVRRYEAEMDSRRAPNVPLNSRATRVFAAVQAMCEWRLGRSQHPGEAAQSDLACETPLKPAELVPCLKKIRSSIEFWNKEGGSHGYLKFVADYVR